MISLSPRASSEDGGSINTWRLRSMQTNWVRFLSSMSRLHISTIYIPLVNTFTYICIGWGLAWPRSDIDWRARPIAPPRSLWAVSLQATLNLFAPSALLITRATQLSCPRVERRAPPLSTWWVPHLFVRSIGLSVWIEVAAARSFQTTYLAI